MFNINQITYTNLSKIFLNILSLRILNLHFGKKIYIFFLQKEDCYLQKRNYKLQTKLMDFGNFFFSIQFVDMTHFYLPLDIALLIDMFKTDIQYLGHYWTMTGRPTLIFPIRSTLLG